MANRILDTDQKNAARILDELWEKYRKSPNPKSMDAVSINLGWANESTLRQFFKARVPVSPLALARLSKFFGVQPSDIYPRMAQEYGMVNPDLSPASTIEKPIDRSVMQAAINTLDKETPEWIDSSAALKAKLIIDTYQNSKPNPVHNIVQRDIDALRNGYG